MPPKKRGRKPKKVLDTQQQEEKIDEPKKIHKKRGRKPKGGKIIKNISEQTNATETNKQNIILQLKCSSKDLKSQSKKLFPNEVYEKDETIASYPINNIKQNGINYEDYNNKINYLPVNKKDKKTFGDPKDEESLDLKEIWEKIRVLKIKLHLNEVSDKNSNCFWCTCSFDNPSVYIPKQERNNIIEVYGCFCSPECAVAFLKNEAIDCSTLWERYALLNNIYGKIYNYDKNIKPAPNPYYTLDKYYGNLTIQEYRKLLSKDRLFLIVNKPLTKILPELYEENNEPPTIFNNILTNNTRQTQKYRLKSNKVVNTKMSILTNTFNLS